MRKIVVATDLSERSDRAVERALRLSSELNSECIVISIIDDALPESLGVELGTRTETRLRTMLDAHGGTNALLDVRRGDVVPGVLGLAEDYDADLLVLGLHRRRDFLDAFRETTMERIVALSARPVLLVRDPVDRPYEKVLVAIDFSRACAEAVSAANRIAPGAEVASIHAYHVPFFGLTGGADTEMARAVRRETEELAAAWQKNHGVLGNVPEVVAGSFREVLERKLKSYRPQVLAIGAHTRSGIGLHKLGSSTASLMRDPPADLLVAMG